MTFLNRITKASKLSKETVDEPSTVAENAVDQSTVIEGDENKPNLGAVTGTEPTMVASDDALVGQVDGAGKNPGEPSDNNKVSTQSVEVKASSIDQTPNGSKSALKSGIASELCASAIPGISDEALQTGTISAESGTGHSIPDRATDQAEASDSTNATSISNTEDIKNAQGLSSDVNSTISNEQKTLTLSGEGKINLESTESTELLNQNTTQQQHVIGTVGEENVKEKTLERCAKDGKDSKSSDGSASLKNNPFMLIKRGSKDSTEDSQPPRRMSSKSHENEQILADQIRESVKRRQSLADEIKTTAERGQIIADEPKTVDTKISNENRQIIGDEAKKAFTINNGRLSELSTPSSSRKNSFSLKIAISPKTPTEAPKPTPKPITTTTMTTQPKFNIKIVL